ncbi:MAG TPA: 4-(cytidine 5'-diphospho)-2-C-methyl-D-erythritol kinase [Terriglobales bacterium]|nr:4-(cytidine 5'-diphospho)-2-C-methyl-D-erythritol kinase [Terriglobales bacterium]
MAVRLRSFAKINLGQVIGPRRPDGFHELRTLYQTLALHDRLTVEVGKGTGIEIRCTHPQVPTDGSNTCHRIARLTLEALKTRARVTITIDKRLPVQGGLGAASSNAVATLVALERALKKRLTAAQHLRLAAEVGSDLPLFLVGGAVLGLGRGEVVLPLEDLPPIPCVVATPEIGVSTAQAFADWDREMAAARGAKLTLSEPSDRMREFCRASFAWLCGTPTGVPARRSRNRAEALLLDLVRAGIENDFERVVFPKYPELGVVKKALAGAGARYASLSGSGSAVYGLFASRPAAARAARKLAAQGIPAQGTVLLSRPEYWLRMSF